MQDFNRTSKIHMVDLENQYAKISSEIDFAILDCIRSGKYINGPIVSEFCNNLSSYLQVEHVIPCGNGTDALQIALMALDLEPGSEVIVPAFTYVASAEVISLLGFKPVLCDVDSDTFNISTEKLESFVTKKTKAIIVVHLYGQSSDMESILNIAKKHDLYVIEDNAQAIGALYEFSDGKKMKTGTIGDIGTTSFFPSKNLGCFGDGGAIITNNHFLAQRTKMIANHGQSKKYYHEVTGVNSRLDSIQAAVLNIKLKYLDKYISSRQAMANSYDEKLKDCINIEIPYRFKKSSHVFHQYTLKIKLGDRDNLKEFLSKRGIPSMVYYPLPLYKQNAFKHFVQDSFRLQNTEELCGSVLSLPIHTEGSQDQIEFIANSVIEFFNK